MYVILKLNSGPATPPPEPSSQLVIDEGESNSQQMTSSGLQVPPPNQEAATISDGLPSQPLGSSIVMDPVSFSQVVDPQGIEFDLIRLKLDNMEPLQWRVLQKLNSKSIQQGQKVQEIQDQIGPMVTTTHYFLNGEEEPQIFRNDQTVMENILGLKNSGLRTRRSLDAHMVKTNNFIDRMNAAIPSLKEDMSRLKRISSSPIALPNADEIEKYKKDLEKANKDIAEALAKADRLSKGSAFSSIDLTARMVEIEQSVLALSQRLDKTAKAVGTVKNKNFEESTNQNPWEYEFGRLKERLDALEREDSDRHSRNLFSDMSESTLTLMQKDIEELQKNTRLQLADSDLNQWLQRKLVAFLDTPEMSDRLKREMRNFGSSLVIQPRNLSRDARSDIVKVNNKIDIKSNPNLLILGCFARNSKRDSGNF